MRRARKKRRRIKSQDAHLPAVEVSPPGDEDVDRGERPQAPSVAYVPMSHFVLRTIATLGLYPALWLSSRADGIFKLSGGRFKTSLAARCCAVTLVSRAAMALSALCAILSFATGSPSMLSAAEILAVCSLSIAVLVGLPLSCFCLFQIRWAIRRAASEWDDTGLMIVNTLPSAAKLFLFGTAYVQLHANRLICLDMPGFSGYDEIWDDASPISDLRSYIRGDDAS